METRIRLTRSRDEAEEWALVLAADGIPHRVEPDGSGWTLVVPDPDVTRAHAALDAYDDEARRPRVAPLLERTERPLPWAFGFTVAALMLAFFAVSGSPAPGSLWFDRGAASARDMLGGEPWRAVTALTLHIDAAHVMGNGVATLVLLPAIPQ